MKHSKSIFGTRLRLGLAGLRGSLTALVVLGLLGGGCATHPLTPLSPADLEPYESVGLREGDTIQITFPGAPSLNTTQQVRRDGKITLDQIGELEVAGKSPTELEQEILRLYDARLVTKQVVVTVASSTYPVFLSGAVLRPGKLMVTESITVMEAIMEAGGFDESRAKSKAVVVTREENGLVRSFRLDVKAMLDGRSTTRFYLRPMDSIYVPSKVQVF